MAKLFNSIRKKLISEKPSVTRTTNYLKYAIGEIVLVMVGILLALQVSTWNEIRKQKNQELKILNNLLVDLKKAETNSLEQISNEELRLEYIVKSLSKEGRKSLLNNNKKDSIIKEILWNLNTSTPVINTYSDLKNSGNLSVISNDFIRQAFTSLEINIRNLNSTLKDRLDVQQINIDGIVINKLNFLIMNKKKYSKYKIEYGKAPNYQALFKQQNILNVIAIKLDFTMSSKKSRITLLHDIQSLIKNIEKELAL
ncbi:MAG: DUF6090 family protein [Flavobacteriaceae bacterium]